MNVDVNMGFASGVLVFALELNPISTTKLESLGIVLVATILRTFKKIREGLVVLSLEFFGGLCKASFETSF